MARVFEHFSQDVDDQAKALNGWQQVYQQLGFGRFQGMARQLEVDAGVLIRECTNRQLRELIVPPPDQVVLGLPLSVMPGSVFFGRPLLQESLMVLNGNSEYDVVSAGSLDLVALAVSRGALETLLSSAEVEWLDRAERLGNFALTPTTSASIKEMLLAVFSQGVREIDHLQSPGRDAELLAFALNQTVSLAMSGDGADHASIVPRRADTRMKVVKRAVDFMQANLHSEIGIAEICAAACTSRRSLQYCFEEFLCAGPQAYLRALRLNEARRTFRHGTDQAITSIANTLGFSSASHFTRHYKLMFDELPSDTLKLTSDLPGGL